MAGGNGWQHQHTQDGQHQNLPARESQAGKGIGCKNSHNNGSNSYTGGKHETI